MSKSPNKTPSKSSLQNKQSELAAAANVLSNNFGIDEAAIRAAAEEAVAKAAEAAATTAGAPLGGNPHLGATPGDAAGADGGKTLPASAEKITAFGSVAWLMMHSKPHKHLFITDLEWAVEPPISLNQCFFWHRGHVPVGYASWAYLSEEAETRMLQGIRKLGPADWKSGDRLWLMDLIVPFGGMAEAAKELREGVFKGKKVKSYQPSPDGSGMAVVEW
ncbi:MAG: toxin-activating lysine-acyltransferase [Rhodobacteraceae bacterium]|nr:toxin-activating lysine-acyltransferase [Paracoccaceae bacterium]